MLSKKHNNSFYWKNKLEALDYLPGAAVTEKDAMWQQLYGRLQEKSPGNKTIWYWVAAGILPVIIITLTMVNNTENILVKQPAKKENRTNATPSFLLPASTESVKLSVSAPIKKEQPGAGIKVKATTKKPVDTIQASESVVMALPKTEAEILTNNTLLNDTVVTNVTAVVVKKKLQIVHINELETFPAQFNRLPDYSKNSLSIKPGKNKANNQIVVTQQNTIGFKIKLSSKN